MTSIKALDGEVSACQFSVQVKEDLSIKPTPLVVPPKIVVLLNSTAFTPQFGIPSCTFTQSLIPRVATAYLQIPIFVPA